MERLFGGWYLGARGLVIVHSIVPNRLVDPKINSWFGTDPLPGILVLGSIWVDLGCSATVYSVWSSGPSY